MSTIYPDGVPQTMQLVAARYQLHPDDPNSPPQAQADEQDCEKCKHRAIAAKRSVWIVKTRVADV